MATVKRKRVSKKSKLSWRKHVNISDVENFLDEQRLEERLGKPLSERTDDELFQVDVGPSNQTELTSKQKRRMMLRERQPKCYSVLQPHSEVPDPVIKRNRVRTKEERKNELLKKKEAHMKRQGILKAKELHSLKNRKLYEIQKANKPKRGHFQADIWNIESSKSNGIVFDEWIDNATKKHTLKGVGKPLKRVPRALSSKTSILPSVETPHPGTSYNPSFEDHQALLQQVTTKETKIIEEEKHLSRVTRGMFSRVTPHERENNWLKEMSESLPVNNDSNNNAAKEEGDDGDYKVINPPVQNKKKNLKQRRKQREQHELQFAKLSAKREKKKIADIYKLRFINKKIENDNKKLEISKIKRLKNKELKSKEPKRLSALKFEEEEIYFNTPQDISGNLRNLKKEGNLLLHRFKSMQRRNILQPTTRHVAKRAKIKRFKKSGHKDDWKITVAKANTKAN